MSWSAEQTQQIVEQFWQIGVVRCPDDNGLLSLKLRRLHGGDYNLHTECLVCSKGRDSDAAMIHYDTRFADGRLTKFKH